MQMRLATCEAYGLMSLELLYYGTEAGKRLIGTIAFFITVQML